MGRYRGMRELLRPPPHRGPLIAAGAVVLTVGVAGEQLRVHPGHGWQLAVAGSLAALVLWLAVQAPLDAGRPRAHESALIVSGLALLAIALVRFAEVLGAEFRDLLGGPTIWTAALEAGAAAAIAARRRSAVAALLAAVSGGLALLAADHVVFDAGARGMRWLLLAIALALALASLPLRATSLRHAVQMVNAAGLAILAIVAVDPVGLLTGGTLPGFWEFVLLAAGCGLLAYAGADRAPGPAYLGALILAAFVAVTTTGASATLKWWPLTLIVLGAAVIAAGLRPRRPLPPEPEAYHHDELPLAARADVTVRVRRD